MLSSESFEEKSRGWKVVERPGWTIGWTATKGLNEPLLLDGENVSRLKLRAISYEKDVVMRRHGVVMGPQAVCAVTAGLSGPGGDNGYWWRAGQRLRRTANFKPTPKSALPFSKQHTQRKGGIASQQNHPHFSSSSSESSSKGLFEATETAEARSRVSTRFCLGTDPETERWDVRLPARLVLGNHPIQFKLEKQFVSEAESFLRGQASCALLGKPLFQPSGRWGSSTSGEGGEERQRGLHVDYRLLIDYRGKVWS